MDKIWYRNPSKSEVIGRCGRDEKTEWPRRTDKKLNAKKTLKKPNIIQRGRFKDFEQRLRVCNTVHYNAVRYNAVRYNVVYITQSFITRVFSRGLRRPRYNGVAVYEFFLYIYSHPHDTSEE